ncbi:MAG: hypothetical protein WCG55_00195 [bacterium]
MEQSIKIKKLEKEKDIAGLETLAEEADVGYEPGIASDARETIERVKQENDRLEQERIAEIERVEQEKIDAINRLEKEKKDAQEGSEYLDSVLSLHGTTQEAEERTVNVNSKIVEVEKTAVEKIKELAEKKDVEGIKAIRDMSTALYDGEAVGEAEKNLSTNTVTQQASFEIKKFKFKKKKDTYDRIGEDLKVFSKKHDSGLKFTIRKDELHSEDFIKILKRYASEVENEGEADESYLITPLEQENIAKAYNKLNEQKQSAKERTTQSMGAIEGHESINVIRNISNEEFAQNYLPKFIQLAFAGNKSFQIPENSFTLSPTNKIRNGLVGNLKFQVKGTSGLVDAEIQNLKIKSENGNISIDPNSFDFVLPEEIKGAREFVKNALGGFANIFSKDLSSYSLPTIKKVHFAGDRVRIESTTLDEVPDSEFVQHTKGDSEDHHTPKHDAHGSHDSHGGHHDTHGPGHAEHHGGEKKELQVRIQEWWDKKFPQKDRASVVNEPNKKSFSLKNFLDIKSKEERAQGKYEVEKDQIVTALYRAENRFVETERVLENSGGAQSEPQLALALEKIIEGALSTYLRLRPEDRDPRLLGVLAQFLPPQNHS